ncbi:MAG: hypothetical protein WC792_05910 [Candidatus Micrarchaeia archaeon]|jgi:hypothetical protein
MDEIEKPRVLFVCRRGISSKRFLEMFSEYLQKQGLGGKFELESGGIADEDLAQRVAASVHVVGIYPEVVSRLATLIDQGGMAAKLHEIGVANLKPDWNARLLEELIGE